MPVHLIEGGYANTYLVQEEDSYVAVDVGTSDAADRIHIYLKNKGSLRDLKMVTATHFHIDHIGGIARLLNWFPGIRVCFFEKVGDYLEGRDKICLFSLHRWTGGLMPVLKGLDNHIKNLWAGLKSGKAGIPLPFFRNALPSGYRAECILSEGNQLPWMPNWELLWSPGHTTDSVCFYNRKERSLITGDTILNMEGSGELNKFCCDCSAIRKSFKRLLQLEVRNILPGHGKPLYDVEGLSNVKRTR